MGIRKDKITEKYFRILFVGNSFTDDTSHYIPDIAASYGYRQITVAHLFIGACSINMHLKNLEEDSSAYYLTFDRGAGWKSYPNYSVREAAALSEWDYVVTMGGTGDGSMATKAESYVNLPELMRRLKHLTGDAVGVFNMTWVGESTHKHPHIIAYEGDVGRMYRDIACVMENTVAPMPEINVLSPTGTAIENARTSDHEGKFTRDGYHLDRCNGRFIAALTFFCALTGEDPRQVSFFPHGMSEKMQRIAIESAMCALSEPYAVTTLDI